MIKIFDTIVLLSITGSISVCILLLLKLLILRRFSGTSQKLMWIFAVLSMAIPIWKFIPQSSVEPIIVPYYDTKNYNEEIIEVPTHENILNTTEIQNTPKITEINISYKYVFAVIWAFGVITFIVTTVISYIRFLVKKKKNSIECTENNLFESARKSLGIRRKIPVRKCKDSDSPFLTGVIFPIIYIPEKSMNEDAERFIYLHELTHYKSGDLFLKWIAFFVNAVHWFNPFCYILRKNINEACEIACDMSVTKTLNYEEKKLYMSTILELILKKGEKDE